MSVTIKINKRHSDMLYGNTKKTVSKEDWIAKKEGAVGYNLGGSGSPNSSPKRTGKTGKGKGQ